MANTLLPSLTPSSTTSAGVLITFPYYGDKFQGAGYYGQSEAIHTIQYSTIHNFTGLINIQGTLATEPEDADWYIIKNVSLGNGITPVFDQTLTVNFLGNHVWVRAVIMSFTAGQINNVLMSHN